MEGGVAAPATSRPRNANGAGLRNFQMQAVGTMNRERLRRLRSFVADKGPEIVGDLLCPWARWSFLLGKALLENDPEAKRFIARIFGRSSSGNAIRSPLQIVVSTFRSASEEVIRDAAKMADVRASVLVVCRLMILMLVMVIGGFGWKWLIVLHLVLFVAQTNQLQFNAKEVGDRLRFQAVHVCLYFLDAVATPSTFASRFLLQLVSSVCVFFCHFGHDTSLAPVLCVPCMCVMLFYTPLWFNGVCLLLLLSNFPWASAEPEDIYIALVFICTVCFVRGLVYVSAGGYCGALFLFLCCIVVMCVGHVGVEMVTPLPLVCALLSCFYTPFRVGSLGTSTVICFLAAVNDFNVKAILWWFVWLAALHSLSYAFSRNFNAIALCFWGSYFTYGCIL